MPCNVQDKTSQDPPCFDSRRFAALFQRTLSNTEDECTHLKEMNERTQEELRELANKYNGAVNEIKDLTDKIKARPICVFLQKLRAQCISGHFVMPLLPFLFFFFFFFVVFQLAEGKQEELTQKGQNEKKELQLRIEEMEEKEQALQARIEALQADNDFTNERLTALQGTTRARAHTHVVFSSFRSLVGRAENLPDFPSMATLPPGCGSLVHSACFTLKRGYEQEKESPRSNDYPKIDK